MLSVSPESTLKEIQLFYKTPSICKSDTHHLHQEELASYKTVKLTQIQTFEDANYFKGIIFTYLCDGWITEVKNHFPEINTSIKSHF